MDATANNALDAGVATGTGISITPEIEGFLHEIRKWAKFIAIFGFIISGLMLVFGIFFNTLVSLLPGQASQMNAGSMSVIMTVVYIAMAVLYFFPFLYLFKFATNMKTALHENNQHYLSDSFENLKSHYKFVGILIIVLIGFYALLIVGGFGAALLGG